MRGRAGGGTLLKNGLGSAEVINVSEGRDRRRDREQHKLKQRALGFVADVLKLLTVPAGATSASGKGGDGSGGGGGLLV